MKKIYFSVMDTIGKAIKFAVAAVLVLMALLMFVEVLRRYFWNQQFAWSEELIRYMAMWVAFLGGAVAYKEKSLVCFDLLSGKLVKKKKLLLSLFSNTLILAFLVFVCYLGFKNISSPSTYMQTSVGMKVSMAFPYAAIPVGTAFMTVFCLNNYVQIIDEYRGEMRREEQTNE